MIFYFRESISNQESSDSIFISKIDFEFHYASFRVGGHSQSKFEIVYFFTFVVEQKTFIFSRSGKSIFAEIAPHFAENIDSFSAHPIRLTFDGDGSNFLLIHLITPTFGFKSGLSHKILQPSAPQIVVTPKDNMNVFQATKTVGISKKSDHNV